MKLEEILNALFAYYVEFGGNKSMEYTYGYMDALAVIDELSKKDAKQPCLSD